MPGQEPQVHRARTQAAGACAGHVCAQLRVLAGGTPRAPPAPAERAALFLRRGRPRGLPAPGSGVSVGRDWQRAAAARLPPRRAESDRLPLPARVGGGGAGGGARPSIFCYYSVMGLLGRPPICHRPRSLITGICHHFPLPMSSALLTAGGGHTHMGLLDTRSCIYTLTHETCGGAMNPVCVWGGGTCISLYVCGPELLRDGYVTACAERASSSRCSQLQIFFRSLGGGGTQVASASSLCGLA